jgi:hypothetical protein
MEIFPLIITNNCVWLLQQRLRSTSSKRFGKEYHATQLLTWLPGKWSMQRNNEWNGQHVIILNFGLMEGEMPWQAWLFWWSSGGCWGTSHFWEPACLSLDSSAITRGGCPAACRSNPCLPQVGWAMLKTSETVSLITGDIFRSQCSKL